MSKRIFCDKCMRMALASPVEQYPKKSQHWKSNCGCKFKESELDDIEVKTKYYTKKHGDLINRTRQPSTKWEFKKK